MVCRDWFKILIAWIFLIVGVPTLAYIFLWTAVQQIFETATIGLQILIGLGILICLVCYVYFGVINLVNQTKECLKE